MMHCQLSGLGEYMLELEVSLVTDLHMGILLVAGFNMAFCTNIGAKYVHILFI